MSLHDNASLSVSKLYQTNLYRSIIFRIIIILVFMIVRYIPNYITLTLKITQYDTNNNYYVRMYIDKKRLPHIGMEGLSVKCWGIHPTSLLWHQS